MSGMNQEIADRGLERAELGRASSNARIGGERIPFEPKELASIITILRGYAPKRYLAIEGESMGGAEYIKEAVSIPSLTVINPKDPLLDIRRSLRKPQEPYDLISIDPRNFPLSIEEIWKYIQGGREAMTGFGKGAPHDYGAAKWKPGTLVIFNFTAPTAKILYFQMRTMDNKLHQSLYAGMIKL